MKRERKITPPELTPDWLGDPDIFPVDEDNIEVAMDAVAETLVPTIGPTTGAEPGEQTQKQVIVRATEHDSDRWKQTAEHLGISVAELIRTLMNEKAVEVLECSHPLDQRKSYPWADFCIKCGKRLRSGKTLIE